MNSTLFKPGFHSNFIQSQIHPDLDFTSPSPFLFQQLMRTIQICMTEFRQENGQVRITKGCKQRNACDVQAESNRTLCYEYPYVRVCHSCCEGDFCNTDMELPPFRNDGTCGQPVVKPLLQEFGQVRSRFRQTFGARRFRRSVQDQFTKMLKTFF